MNVTMWEENACNGSAPEALRTNLFGFDAINYDYGDVLYGRSPRINLNLSQHPRIQDHIVN